jgi:hypothetical protein
MLKHWAILIGPFGAEFRSVPSDRFNPSHILPAIFFAVSYTGPKTKKRPAPPFLSGSAGMLRPRSVERETVLKSKLAFLARASGGFGRLGRLGRGLSGGGGGGGGRGRFGLGRASATASAGGGSCRSSRVRFAHILLIIRFRLRFVWSLFDQATAMPMGISHARESQSRPK